MKITSLLNTMVALTILFAAAILTSLSLLVSSMTAREEAFRQQVEFSSLANELEGASDFLTDKVRSYVQFGEKQYYNEYWKEVNETKTRDKAVKRLKELGAPESLFSIVEQAKKKSDMLVKLENAGMNAVKSGSMDYARQFVFGPAYINAKAQVTGPLDKFQKELDGWAASESAKASQKMTICLAMTAGSTILLLLSLSVSLFIFKRKIKPLRKMTEAAERVARGNLAIEKINVPTKDEIGILASSINHMIDSLKKLIADVNLASVQLASSSEELTASSEQSTVSAEATSEVIQELASGAETQMNAIQEGSSLLEEIAGSAEQMSANIQAASKSAKTAAEKGKEGDGYITASINQMNAIHSNAEELSNVIKELGQRSAEIGSIVSIITGIADQTNLLALNAAIEAARAGEQGKGFAVVADEVRKLAEQSANSASQISSIIRVIQNQTAAAVGKMDKTIEEASGGISAINKAGTSFKEIIAFAKTVSDEVNTVAEAAEKLADGTARVKESIMEISEAAKTVASGAQSTASNSQESLAVTEEISSSAAMLSKMAEDLQLQTSKFTM